MDKSAFETVLSTKSGVFVDKMTVYKVLSTK